VYGIWGVLQELDGSRQDLPHTRIALHTSQTTLPASRMSAFDEAPMHQQEVLGFGLLEDGEFVLSQSQRMLNDDRTYSIIRALWKVWNKYDKFACISH
jgi:hypothetical protein